MGRVISNIGIVNQKVGFVAYSTVYNSPGTYYVTIPLGCIQLVMECYGGGGAGSGSVSASLAGGGGGGGCYVKTITDSPLVYGNEIVVVVAAARAGILGNASNGNDSVVNFTGVGTFCLAKGGKSAIGTTGGAGTTTNCIGTIKRAGGSGANGNQTDWYSGGGGGAAGSTTTGSNGSSYNGGAGGGGYAGSGAEGNFDPDYLSGNPGNVYGGGGSGALLLNPYYSNLVGGGGAQGLVKITFN
jgi:hypothetical protein